MWTTEQKALDLAQIDLLPLEVAHRFLHPFREGGLQDLSLCGVLVRVIRSLCPCAKRREI